MIFRTILLPIALWSNYLLVLNNDVVGYEQHKNYKNIILNNLKLQKKNFYTIINTKKLSTK